MRSGCCCNMANCIRYSTISAEHPLLLELSRSAEDVGSGAAAAVAPQNPVIPLLQESVASLKHEVKVLRNFLFCVLFLIFLIIVILAGFSYLELSEAEFRTDFQTALKSDAERTNETTRLLEELAHEHSGFDMRLSTLNSTVTNVQSNMNVTIAARDKASLTKNTAAIMSHVNRIAQTLIQSRNKNASSESIDSGLALLPTDLPRTCMDIKVMDTAAQDGEYTIQIIDRFVHRRLHVRCDMNTLGGGWTLIQRRGQHGNPEDYFFRAWSDYFHGFGDLTKEFWMGLDNIQALAEQNGEHELLVQLWAQNGSSTSARYDSFKLSDDGHFKLLLGKYSGDAGDGLDHSRRMSFSTHDRDADDESSGNCAEFLTGAWWYGSCTYANLNGRNYDREGVPFGKGIVWGGEGVYAYTHSLSRAEMKIRRKVEEN